MHWPSGWELKGGGGEEGEPGQALFKILLGFLTSGKLGTLAVFFFRTNFVCRFFKQKIGIIFLNCCFSSDSTNFAKFLEIFIKFSVAPTDWQCVRISAIPFLSFIVLMHIFTLVRDKEWGLLQMEHSCRLNA